MKLIMNDLVLRQWNALLGSFDIGRAQIHGNRLHGLDLLFGKLEKDKLRPLPYHVLLGWLPQCHSPSHKSSIRNSGLLQTPSGRYQSLAGTMDLS
jgi:hypothetical protein